MSTLLQDIRLTVRNMRRAPAFFAAVILTLGLGIGANTAVFSIVETVLLEPVPYPDPDELVSISGQGWIPAEIVLDVQQSGDSFDRVAAYYPGDFAVTGGPQPYQLEGARVTHDFFRLFEAETALGRGFAAADARVGAPGTAIISHAVWQRRYGGSREVIGRTLRIDGEIREIVGVLEPGFRLFAPRTDNPGVWIPFQIDPTNSRGLNQGLNWVIPIARLEDGASLRQAQSELDAAMTRFKERHPEAAASWDIDWATLGSELVHDVRAALLVLQLAVGVLLLIACVNVANLLLARYSSRRREVAIRSALGASGGRLVRQMLAESLVVSVLGGLAGLLPLLFGVELIPALAPHVPRVAEVSVDAGVFIFTLGASIATALLVGIIPAVITSRRAPNDALKEGGRTPDVSRKQRRIGHGLVVAEVALALMLLVAAGLLGRSFISLTGEDPGFRTEDVLALSIQVPANRYQSLPELTGFYRRVLGRLRQIPGVESAALSKNPPISRGGSIRTYVLEGADETDGEGEPAEYDVISPGYFRLLDIPLLKGRGFEETDQRGTLPVAIIDMAMWREAWPGQDPIGKRLRIEEDRWLTVVGVVGDIRGSGLANDPRPGVYISYRQRPETPTALAVAHGHTVLLVRSRPGAGSLSQGLRQGIWDVDPQQPIPEIVTLESIVSEEVSPQRFRALLLGAFAAIALILVVAGIYGVISFTVSRQTHEIGIRMALGARSGRVLQHVIAQAMALTALGLLIGLAGAAILTRSLSSLLYGVSATDPLTFAAVSAVILGVALLASYLPARRAARLDPTAALRAE